MTTKQRERAYCAESPTLAHYWMVTVKVETCRHCDTSRPWDIDGTIMEGQSKKGPLSPRSEAMRQQILALEVGEECVVDHRHLVCHLYAPGTVKKCAIGTTLARLRGQLKGAREWHYHHEAQHFATVKRTK